MNPCPCGYYDDRSDRCRCTPEQVRRYRGKVSGPLLDRIDVHIEVPDVSPDILERQRTERPETSASVLHRVIRAWRRQLARTGRQNHLLSNEELDRHCRLGTPQTALLRKAVQRLNLSTRGMYRILRVARTVADLAESETIRTEYLSEAISCRNSFAGA